MSKILNKIFSNAELFLPLIFLLATGSAIIGALLSQYVWGFNPCNLCIFQRIPYYVIIALSILAILLRSKQTSLMLLLGFCIIAFVAEIGIAGFHVGVEQKWWTGTESCGGGDVASSIEALRAQIMGAPISRCDDPSFYFLGITMAAWNFIYSIGLLIFTIYSLKRVIKNRKASSKNVS